MTRGALSFVAVGLGGFLGSIGRYGVGLLIAHWLPRPAYFLGTLTVNMAGCLLIGLAAGLLHGRSDGFSEHLRLLVVVGVLGGFTTYSSFGLESFVLLREGRLGGAILYVGTTLVIGLGAVALGFSLGSWGRNTYF